MQVDPQKWQNVIWRQTPQAHAAVFFLVLPVRDQIRREGDHVGIDQAPVRLLTAVRAEFPVPCGEDTVDAHQVACVRPERRVVRGRLLAQEDEDLEGSG